MNASGGGEVNTANDTASDTTLVGIPDLAMFVTDPGGMHQGGSGSFQLYVSNAGSRQTAGTVTVVDMLPDGVTPAAADNGALNGWTVSTNGHTVSATRGDVLLAGATYPVLTIAVSAAANAPASVTDAATVSGGGEVNMANDTASDTALLTSHVISWQSVETDSDGLGNVALPIADDGLSSEPRRRHSSAAGDFRPAGVDCRGHGELRRQ